MLEASLVLRQDQCTSSTAKPPSSSFPCSFSPWPQNGWFITPNALCQNVLPFQRPESTVASRPRIDISKLTSQNKSFLLWSWLSRVFVAVLKRLLMCWRLGPCSSAVETPSPRQVLKEIIYLELCLQSMITWQEATRNMAAGRLGSHSWELTSCSASSRQRETGREKQLHDTEETRWFCRLIYLSQNLSSTLETMKNSPSGSNQLSDDTVLSPMFVV